MIFVSLEWAQSDYGTVRVSEDNITDLLKAIATYCGHSHLLTPTGAQ